MFGFDPNDTTWSYFWVIENNAVKENNDFLIGNKVIVRPTIGRSFEFVCASEHNSPNALKIYNSAGVLVWTKKISTKETTHIKWYGTDQLGRGLSPGVYIVRFGDVTKRIILTK
jgi:flagellar hook assembly protein FlgD